VSNLDGTAHHLAVAMGGNHLRVAGDGPQRTAAATILPAGLWNAGIVREDMVRADGAKVPAHPFTISGGLNRDVWFDKSNTLVRVQFAAKDGTTIVYELR